MTIKAIETVYKGYKFRSRLEARWAVFFDALGIEWEYELEGFEFELIEYGKIRYLPDFYIPAWDKYIEIKPLHKTRTKDELLKCGGFAQKKEKTLLVIFGQPWPTDYTILSFIPTFSEQHQKMIVSFNSSRAVFALGHTSNTIYLFYPTSLDSIEPANFYPLSQEFYGYQDKDGNSNAMWILTNEEMQVGKMPLVDDIENNGIEIVIDTEPIKGYRLGDAYRAARQARFEHGQGRP